MKLSTKLLERIRVRRMMKSTALRDPIDRAFGNARVTFKPSHQKGVFATLWIEAPEEQKALLQYRAAILCCQIHDETRMVVVPIILTPGEDAEAA